MRSHIPLNCFIVVKFFHGNLDGSLSRRAPFLIRVNFDLLLFFFSVIFHDFCYHPVSLLTAFRSTSPQEAVHWILCTGQFSYIDVPVVLAELAFDDISAHRFAQSFASKIRS